MPLLRKLFVHTLSFPKTKYVPNLKSLAQIVWKYFWLFARNFMGHVTKATPFFRKFIYVPAWLFQDEPMYQIWSP